ITPTPSQTRTPTTTFTARATPTGSPPSASNEHAIMYWYAAGMLVNPTPQFYHTGAPLFAGIETNFQTSFPLEGQMKNLSVNCHSPISSGGQKFVVRKNGADTGVTCTVCATPPGCCAAGTTCTNTTCSSDMAQTVGFTALDAITLESVATQNNS